MRSQRRSALVCRRINLSNLCRRHWLQNREIIITLTSYFSMYISKCSHMVPNLMQCTRLQFLTDNPILHVHTNLGSLITKPPIRSPSRNHALIFYRARRSQYELISPLWSCSLDTEVPSLQGGVPSRRQFSGNCDNSCYQTM